jgi:hypothetical protein
MERGGASSVGGRRAWVLLLLAAVFAMHALQCAAADSGPTPGMHGTPHTTVTESDPAPRLAGPGAVMASAQEAITAPPLAAVLSAAATGVPSQEGHGSAPRGSGHLWALCLAILTAGLAALLMVLAGRLPELRRSLSRRSGVRSWGRPYLLRPPDLYFLCLMRI